MSRRALLPLAFFLLSFAAALLVSGGFVTAFAGTRLSARSPAPAATAGALTVAVWWLLAHHARASGEDLRVAREWLHVSASRIVLVVAAVAAAAAIFFGTFSAAGADASGYLSQALMLSQGRLSYDEPLFTQATWPDAAASFAPLGWWPALWPGGQVPTYAVGLPLLMAPLVAVGGTLAACLIAPALFLTAVWLTGKLAAHVAGPAAGILAAVWLATSPVALREAMQPMSDVPVTAFWLACWWFLMSDRRRVWAAGLCAAAAVLIRPNLAPLAAVPAVYLLTASNSADRRARNLVAFVIPVAVSMLLVASLQWHWFGSPLRSGYGKPHDIYSLSNVWANLELYTRWLMDTHGPWLLAAPAAFFVLGAPPSTDRRDARWLLAFAAAVCAAYLVYAQFEVWTYLRFVLPALAMAMVVTCGMIALLISRAPAPAHAPLIAGIALAIAAANLSSTRAHDVFKLAARHSRSPLVAAYLDSVMRQPAVVVASEQSGAVRYYTGRSVLRWDAMAPDSLAAAIETLTARRTDLWIVLDEWEEDPFRRRFAGVPVAALDWPPAVEVAGDVRTRGWRLADRDRFRRGERTWTDRLR